MNSFERVPATGWSTSRRSFLGIMAAVAIAPVLASCTTTATGTAGAAGGAAKVVLPAYVPVNYVKPDIASVDGSTQGFTTWPSKLVQSVAEVPGKGSSFTAMIPTFGSVLPGLADSQYLQGVNKELNAKFDFQQTDFSGYVDKLEAVLAAPNNVPDFVTTLASALPPRLDQALPGVFTDLGPYVSGDKVKKYPNLANIPTAAWKACVFSDKIYALPYPSDTISRAIFYRKDITDGLGITDLPKTSADFLAFLKEITDPSAKRWGGNDLMAGSFLIYSVPETWLLDKGKLVHRYESDQYRAALDFTSQLFKAGVIHPDAVAGLSSQDKQRFQSGQAVVSFDGYSGWVDSANVLPGNPTYNQQAMPWMSADGSKPIVFRGPPSNVMTFVKKQTDPKRVEEILALVNYIAAPFGTTENNLLTNGIEGVHWNADPATGTPVLTDLGHKEVGSMYSWIVRPPADLATVAFPQLVKDYCTFMADTMQYAVEPVFYGQEILPPVQYASLSQPFDDLEKDISRGRKTLKDLDAAIATWKSQGGDELRKYYAKYLEN